jgi:hypothetical protein
MICGPCAAGLHEQCSLGECECRLRKDAEEVQLRVRSLRAVDERLADLVFKTVLQDGSKEARILSDEAGRDTVCLFVRQILLTLRTMNC